MILNINTDGASRGNPGKASYGIVIKNDEGEILDTKKDFLGITTNNIAEYTGVLEALKLVKNRYNLEKIKKINIISDSELLVKQLNKIYKVKNLNLKKYFDEIERIKKEFIEKGIEVSFKHVKREYNKEADALANEVLDNI